MQAVPEGLSKGFENFLGFFCVCKVAVLKVLSPAWFQKITVALWYSSHRSDTTMPGRFPQKALLSSSVRTISVLSYTNDCPIFVIQKVLLSSSFIV